MTPYHSQYWAHLLTLKGAGGSIENLSRSISNARVDLNPHQVDAALFALRSPLPKGAILADDVGLGKTIEAGIVLSQRWAERKRRILLIVPAQMQEHFDDGSPSYEVHVSRGFTTLTPSAFNAPNDENPRPFRIPIDEKKNIRSMLFGGFSKCLFPVQKFDSDTERRFSVMLENDATVLKWVKPSKNTFQIHYEGDANYEPDFVVETDAGYYLCEPKAEQEIEDTTVKAKAHAAALWCKHASSVSSKPWVYVLVPHSAIDESKSLVGLAAQYTVKTE